MLMVYLSLALAAVTAPDGTRFSHAMPLPILQSAALSLEVIDHRERGFLFADESCRETDLGIVRRRYTEIGHAPFVIDADRFPCRRLYTMSITSNRAYRSWLSDRLCIDRGEWVHEAILDTDALYSVWDAVRDAKSDRYFVATRRAALLRLRELIGAHAYYMGLLPPPVPVWWYRRID